MIKSDKYKLKNPEICLLEIATYWGFHAFFAWRGRARDATARAAAWRGGAGVATWSAGDACRVATGLSGPKKGQ